MAKSSARLADDADVDQQDDIHHQRIEDGRDGHLLIGEDNRAGSDCDGLGSVLHPYFDNHRPAPPAVGPHQAGQERRAADGHEDERRDAQAQDAYVLEDGPVMLDIEDGDEDQLMIRGMVNSVMTLLSAVSVTDRATSPPEYDIFNGLTVIDLVLKWREARLPAEAHYFAYEGHGFGYAPEPERWRPSYAWIDLFYTFMQKSGFLGRDRMWDRPKQH